VSCRFLYVIGELRPGGSERQLYYLLKSMNRRLYHPEVAVWDFREADHYVAKIRALGIPVHSLAKLSKVNKLRTLRKMVRQLKPDIVHSYSFHTNFAAFYAALGTRSIAIGGVRSDLEWARRECGPLLGRLSARWPHRQIFNSAAAVGTKHRLDASFGRRQRFVIRNGLDMESFQQVPMAETGKVHIVGIGSLFPVKRWDRVISAALALQREGLDFSIKVAGDGPLRDSLKQQSDLLGVGAHVDFIGNRTDVATLLGEASFLVHTSDNEGCPNAVMEAMACGRAVVATDVGDVSALIENGKTGIVVPRGNDVALVQAMANLIEDRQLCLRMGQAGRTKAEREFGLDRLLSQTLAAYKAVGWKAVLN